MLAALLIISVQSSSNQLVVVFNTHIYACLQLCVTETPFFDTTSTVSWSNWDIEEALFEFKQAVIWPLLKKNWLDNSELKNFRLVSNLSFISKLLEKIVQTRIQAFFDSNGLMPKMQSAYRRFHTPIRRWRRCSAICWLLQTVIRCQLFACSTLQQPLTLSTMTCCYSGLDCVALC